MLHRKLKGCESCVESSSCEFSSEFCPKTALELKLDSDIADDPVFKKYYEFYQRLKN
ncbi:hypothetical protein [Sporomusa acidovorans]|uniref:4Fe-4S ferredoxin-type domain-containing protein n=1 Tax=Sporomusa acidovorans (strain ATCC 49682 / DSM 3132 / Mol) TaxID=1123286 RepID=A0ABZ3J9K0_SPOA4|nr:hypothetical protein [Sporomusa acidovorans]OZC21833.1 hypothetical protein SPACI_19080 [Sporomusa acidovorans DSM 3132]SDD55495.1 hypothetical protein SAMN04488499_100225 [Sporomusa acidovorans]